MNDDLDGIFDNLEPADFALTTSCVIEEAYPVPGPVASWSQSGEREFAHFVDTMLHQTRYAFAASDGKINPVGVLANDKIRRTFTPDDDETLRQFLRRLRREAMLMNAHWFYIAQVTQVATVPVADETDLSSVDIVSAADNENPDRFRAGVLWYAERREADAPRFFRAGVIEVLNYTLGQGVETHVQPVHAYGQILDK